MCEASASGLRRFSLWCLRVRPGVSLLPVLVTWLLPVAGTTYKPAVIKVFDLLSLPAETHISRPANTALLPPWSMTEGEARATNWQCRDWTRGGAGTAREGGKGAWRGEVSWEEEWTGQLWSEGWWDKPRNVQASCWAAHLEKNIKISLLAAAIFSLIEAAKDFTQLHKQENKFLCC